MNLLFALFSVAAARFSEPLNSVHANSHREIRALWQAKGDFLKSLSSVRVFHTLSTPDQQAKCNASFSNFLAQADTCLSPVSTIFAPDSNDTSTDVHSKIDTYCSAGGCHDMMTTLVMAIKADCVDTGVFAEICASRGVDNCTSNQNDTLCAVPPNMASCQIDPQFFAPLRMVLQLFCLQSTPTATAPAKYCVPSFYDFVNVHPTDIAGLTTQLTNGCDECTLKIFGLWSKVEPFEAAIHFIQLGNVCLKRANTFCAIHQMELDAAQNATADCGTFQTSADCTAAPRGCQWDGTKCGELWTSVKLASMCHPCTLAYANRALFTMKVMDQLQLPDPNSARQKAEIAVSIVEYTVNGVCSTDLQDQFCLPKLQAQSAGLDCAGMTTYLKATGCCAPSILDFSQGLCNLDQVVHPTTSTCQAQIDSTKAAIQMCSGLNLGPTCAKEKYLLVHQAIVSGIDATWYAAHKDTLVQELKQVIAFDIGIDVGLIIGLEIAAATNSTGRRLLQSGDLQATTTINVPNAGASSSAFEGLTGQLEPLSLNDAIQKTTPGGTLNSASVMGTSTTNVAVIPAANANTAYSVGPIVSLAVVGVSIFLQY
jgi:hypothetical protein